ncbi:uncharacterized protein FFUJ_05551 [Fusarium fujikuroi IMI 58289]|uniref:Uncharacterized protein n=1 Tax=Gibberella fujikuroi (strain CBS 195.34 / IMI 58289 / NRRL A-6831) TaxID=1279085 RepID=S0E467_GIBF5|nr:uncharacterized protein FFUJ_05551 [Fusarium fujikuroi IMI 58289]KLP03221.1 uncharacterized protein LW94_5976 [Fusarium fujikuroi]CCT69649.1 uncharacterized protein FFUJ_05551 [Fusarium fujikuroi IMI 58289]SCO26686.1 uncharacterized protein FFM5_14955 [Fusarium fujikuroi]SCV59567.1 uncharacterized protein FFFS_14136 [Fusarium fujikuroi]
MSTKRCFLRLPPELRLHIYRDYFQLEGGYVYDAKSDKLKTSDGQPIDLALIFTCRTIANETSHLPLSLNSVTFSMLYREDWQSLAGCFNVVATYYRHLEADLVLHLAEFMTPEMYGQFALKYPDFANRLEDVSTNHRPHYLDDNNNNLSRVMAAESASGAKRARVERLKGRRCCVAVHDILTTVNHIFKWGEHEYEGFSKIHRDPFSSSHPSKAWFGSDSEVQDALSYCLRLIADKKPVQFANHLRGVFPHWAGSDIVEDFLHLRFDNWAIPLESEVKNAIRLLDIDGIWECPDRWHYADPRQDSDHEFDNSEDGQYDDQDYYEEYDDYDQSDGQDDEDTAIMDGPDTNVHVRSGVYWREKIRFSAAANAIRFLKRIPLSDPHTHARGLAPFVNENPSLQITRRVSLLDCIIGVWDPPYSLVMDLQRGERIQMEPMWIRPHLSRNIGYWIRDALAAKDVGIPAESFTFRLEAGSHQDFCTDLLQRIVHRDIAWHRAYKLLDANSTFPHDALSAQETRRWMMRDADVKAIDELVNRTSGVLSADFNTGVALDGRALAKETEHLHGFYWVAKWRLMDGTLKQESPPGLIYDRLADVVEFRTDDGPLVAYPEAT